MSMAAGSLGYVDCQVECSHQVLEDLMDVDIMLTMTFCDLLEHIMKNSDRIEADKVSLCLSWG